MPLWDKLVITFAVMVVFSGFCTIILFPLMDRFNKDIPWWAAFPLLLFAILFFIAEIAIVIALVVLRVKAMRG